MKIVCISDTHGFHNKVLLPEGDILIFAGDMSKVGLVHQIKYFDEWLGLVKPHYKEIIIIAGNHDFAFEELENAKELIKNAIYLQNSCVVIDGLKIYGSPYTPRFFNWAFNVDRGEEIAKHWALIPDDVDILITHGPPAGILDMTSSYEWAGCKDLMNRINKLKNLKLHIFGHIHEGYGVEKINDITFVNASICTQRYSPINKPIIIEI